MNANSAINFSDVIKIMAYIIGSYNKYDSWHREHRKYTFEINGVMYAVFEVEMEWGLPKLPVRTDRNESAYEYHIYDTYSTDIQASARSH